MAACSLTSPRFLVLNTRVGKRKWYSKTRFGYARGHEPVRFVENIRSYYKILVWLTSSEAKLMLVENEIHEGGQSAL